MSNNTLIRIKATRKLQVTYVPSPMYLKFSTSDLSTTEPGSIVIDSTGNVGIISEVIEDTIKYFNKDITHPLAVGIKDVVTIHSIFRFSDSDIVIFESGVSFLYSGRLFSNSITESLGGFLEKNQVTSSSSVKLRNNDLFLSKVYHSYNLLESSVDILFGTTDRISDYDVIFSGVATVRSGFTYSDSVFSFKVKDSRSDLLSTPIIAGRYLAKDFPLYGQYELGSPIAYITLTAAAPAAWVPGTVIQRVANDSPIATVVNVSGTQVFIYNYTGQFILNDPIIGLGVTATVSSVTPITSGTLSLKGDTGHFIGNTDIIADTIIPVTPSSATLLGYYERRIDYGLFSRFANYEPIFAPFNTTINSDLKGYLHRLTFQVNAATGVTAASLTIVTPHKTISKPIMLSAIGSQYVDLSADSLQVFGGPISIHMEVTGIIGKEFNRFHSSISNIQLTLQPRSSASASYSTIIPVGLNSATGPGILSFNSTDGNLVKVTVKAATIANPNSDVLLGSNVGGGFPIPLSILGSTVNKITLTITINASANFLKVVDLLSMSINYPLANIIGTTLPSSIVNSAKPIIYGDFSTSPLPTVLLRSTKTVIADYSFTPPTLGPNTGAVNFNSNVATQPILMGDSISYTGASGSTSSGEQVIAKVTQVIGTFVSGGASSGQVYFENLGIVPSTGSAINISRVTNVYKVSASPIQAILGYEYQPKSSDTHKPLPPTTQVIQENLSSGEFTLTGINPVDPIFVKCLGKPDINGVLIEDPISILEDISNTYLKSVVVSVDPAISASLSSMKLRRYLNNGDNFDVVLQDIQKSTNTASFIATNNAISIFRYNSTIVPKHTFYEDQVVTGSFAEQYDPQAIALTGADFSYNYDFITDNYKSVEFRGVNNSNNKTMLLPWVYRNVDAIAVADDMIDMLLIQPEIIHVTILSDTSNTVSIGDIVNLIRKESIHDFLVTQYIKAPTRGTVELYGINLSDNYAFGYPAPTITVFPKELTDLVGSLWTVANYTSTPSYLNNPNWDNNVGQFSVDMGFHGMVNTDNVNMVRGSSTTSIEITGSGNPKQAFYTKTLLHDNSHSIVHLTAANAQIDAGMGTLYFTSIPASSINTITGNYNTDMALFNSTPQEFTILAIAGTISMILSVPINSVAIVYIQGPLGSIISIDNLILVDNKDYNTTITNGVVQVGSIYSYKQWNSKWPRAFKEYIMDRFIPIETMPNLNIMSSLGDIEPMFKNRVIQ